MKRFFTFAIRSAITVWLAAKSLCRRRMVVLLPLALAGCSHTRLEYGGAVYETFGPAWSVKQIKSIEVGYGAEGLPVFKLNGYNKDDATGFRDVSTLIEGAARGAASGAVPGP